METISFMKTGGKGSKSWYLLVFGWSHKVSTDGTHIDVTEGRTLFVTKDIYDVCKVGMTITIKER